MSLGNLPQPPGLDRACGCEWGTPAGRRPLALPLPLREKGESFSLLGGRALRRGFRQRCQELGQRRLRLRHRDLQAFGAR